MTKVNVILAETGKQNANLMGTLDLLNAGIANVGLVQAEPGLFVLPSLALAIFIETDFAKAGRALQLSVELLDYDGKPVTVPGHTAAIAMHQSVRPRPTLGPAGTPVRAYVFAALQGLPLFPDTVYKWKITLDGESKEDWEATFYVAPLDSQPRFGGDQAGPSGAS